mmetsp:Transcript_47775/g.138088  ORF Transcript_47775/g.138088 Transcript_47775/m.138088 type:complete len:289 (+) Transcript_47775:1159-2025(+)
MVFRNCLGMMQSVSTFAFRNGAAMTPSSFVNFGMPPTAPPAATLSPAAATTGCGRVSGCEQNSFGSLGCFGFGAAALSGCLPLMRARTSFSLPVTAAAAAIAGLMRCVRPCGPCRPSKFLFDVAAQRSLGFKRSVFMPRHMEQPGSRQSKPASVKIASNPSASACFFTKPEPGTIMAYTPSATLRPRAMLAALRRSSIRLFVQEPMKTLSTARSSIFTPGSKPMYMSIRSMPSRFVGSSTFAGSGTTPVMGTTSSGLVPHVTVGAMSLASMWMSLSKVAPSSVLRDFQ